MTFRDPLQPQKFRGSVHPGGVIATVSPAPRCSCSLLVDNLQDVLNTANMKVGHYLEDSK